MSSHTITQEVLISFIASGCNMNSGCKTEGSTKEKCVTKALQQWLKFAVVACTDLAMPVRDHACTAASSNR